MAKYLRIQIPKPCHENWSEMTPNQQGAYCRSCQKTVIDFTGKTQNEVYDLLNNCQTEVCGRFREDQVNNPIVKTEINSSFFNWKAIAASLAALVTAKEAMSDTGKLRDTAISCLSSNIAMSEPSLRVDNAYDTIVKPVNRANEVDSINKLPTSCVEAPIDMLVRGQVVDKKTKRGIANVRVELNDNKSYSTTTDEKGNFVLIFPSGLDGKVSFTSGNDGTYYSRREMELTELLEMQTKIRAGKNPIIKLTPYVMPEKFVLGRFAVIETSPDKNSQSMFQLFS